MPSDATAFAHRDKAFMLALINGWDGRAGRRERAPRVGASDCGGGAAARRRGVYVNFLQVDEGDRIREAYPGETYERLVAVKRRYDPDNFFCLNQNIAP